MGVAFEDIGLHRFAAGPVGRHDDAGAVLRGVLHEVVKPTRLKSLEGGNAGKPCEAAPHGVAVKAAFFKAHLKENIFDQPSDDARRKAADRAVKQLIDAGKIGRLDDFVWTV